ncbi:alpha/beta fold hydrolase [Rhodoferax sp. PAMC 29310]|uniref:alpha/beta fold hydrolase n=1 Tax=Rhodoferax sp. PAMC 29310 TaxID=2822760 RepID=UPI001B3277F1|nr:alpha/beta hydrolase [Rhodoferax sp. PAMC 29310]
MTEPTLNYVHCPDALDGHRMAFWQWGNPSSKHVVLCVHGLTRQGRDFDTLAHGLCERSNGTVRVICPDVVGRGQSDWLKDPEAYQLPTYAADMLALLAQLQPTTLDWVGTSMGGLIGMVVCGTANLPLPVPVRRLVLNDVGPALEWTALQRIGEYLGRTGRFKSVQQAADLMWTVSSSFGPHTSAEWLALSQYMVKPLPDGSGDLTLHYDPAIAQPFSQMTEESVPASEAQLWQLYDQIQANTLLVRGAESDLLSRQTALAMGQRGPKARLIEFVGVGHAPTFVADDQVAALASFLLE